MTIVLDPTQETAVQMLVNSRSGVVTGGPGTGKTTILKEALSRMRGRLVGLVAPTGKAAKRITEVTNTAAFTVHRLLDAKGGPGRWEYGYNAQNPLTHDVLIVDESSMLDTETAAALLDAVNTQKTRLFFMGDVDQLPSVGPGRVFEDIISSNALPVVRLEKVHRSALESWVCRNAPLILSGDIDILTPCPDFRVYKMPNAEKLARALTTMVTESMPAAGIKDIQVLAPQNSGDIGIEKLNNYLQSAINPIQRIDGEDEPHFNAKTSKGGKYAIRARDRVMATENNYDKNVFNGEIGEVVEIKDDKMFVDFDGNVVDFTREEASTLRLAYALTIHKSQGSEWDWVAVVVHGSHHYMWNRQLLYTAVTRAKKGVVMFYSDTGLSTALTNNDPRSRTTTLYNRIIEHESDHRG